METKIFRPQTDRKSVFLELESDKIPMKLFKFSKDIHLDAFIIGQSLGKNAVEDLQIPDRKPL